VLPPGRYSLAGGERIPVGHRPQQQRRVLRYLHFFASPDRHTSKRRPRTTAQNLVLQTKANARPRRRRPRRRPWEWMPSLPSLPTLRAHYLHGGATDPVKYRRGFVGRAINFYTGTFSNCDNDKTEFTINQINWNGPGKRALQAAIKQFPKQDQGNCPRIRKTGLV
jgi:hypothetical protein